MKIDHIIWLLIIVVGIFLFFSLIKFTNKTIKNKLYLKKISKSGIKEIDRMDGYQFEIYLKSLLKELGYKSSVTNKSHDFGADLIVVKGTKKIVIQAKRYGYKNNVSIDAIQQVYTSMPYYKANEAWVLTNSFFTKNARILGKSCNVKLYDRYKLIDFINEVNPITTPSNIRNNIPAKSRKCPKCTGELIQRKSNTGNIFMGCKNYPNCTHTEPVAK